MKKFVVTYVRNRIGKVETTVGKLYKLNDIISGHELEMLSKNMAYVFLRFYKPTETIEFQTEKGGLLLRAKVAEVADDGTD